MKNVVNINSIERESNLIERTNKIIEGINDPIIFESEEFGQVRTIQIDSEVWFVGKDIVERLGYKNISDTLRKHVDEDDKGVAKCDTLGGKQNLIIINESGLYSLILSSKLPNAKRFKRWVTSEILPSLRKTGMYELPKDLGDFEDIMIAQLQEQKNIKQQLNQVNYRALQLEAKIDNLPLLAADSNELTAVAKRKIVGLLGGKGAPAYKLFNRKAFSDLYHELHRQFDVNKICAIKRKDLDEAKEIVKNYILPRKLKKDVEIANNQMILSV
ncbi:MAG: BRO family protein [Sarcina sp.]